MKRVELIRLIGRAASEAELDWSLVREGSGHELWELDGERVSVPRHREINEDTARGILKALEVKLGTGWWRR